MIFRDKILIQLHRKEASFHDFDGSLLDESKTYKELLGRLAELSSAELSAQLNGPTPGALPTAEFDTAPNLCLPFAQRWNNHAEARDWACETLLGHTTFAVDGSQIPPHPGFSIPVAAVQVAWFENHHTREGSYVKETEIEILSPDDLKVEHESDRAEQKINVRRFELEVGKLCSLLKDFANRRTADSPLPVALFDSSLVISFADRLQENMRARHVNAMLELLQCSEEAGIPVIGYVDASDARDLIRMIGNCFGLPDGGQLHDGELLRGLLKWGDRTPMFECKRGGAIKNQESVLELFEAQGQPIGFVYLQTTGQLPPARLEIPMWVYQQGLLEEVLNIIRAEVVVGNGYPYAIEAADATAVINTRDRESFYALFQQFAEKQNIELRVSPKAASKVRRRYN
ncbi:MAG TPA: DNA double-strand break repair nuclease NurA [Blastocatellia bacterium]|nr:DNA double-strand break repair nuclease NurA [Blastocatellia bacterium]HMV86674.1 DNA double-strand break repair nuclease NurA [Blastocatellia bacterium]HMZ17159.1 DNA double-strand break repair nuclease NurA [Blastocatellia bacterium]HNG30749.1 DNA double-strand break repair nuclease NurA [Blastocatellia bacterium]